MGYLADFIEKSLMRRILTVLLSALLFVTGTVSAEASRLHQVLDRGVLRVATTGDIDPLALYNPVKKAYEGYDIDLATELARDLGVKVRFVRTTWPDLLEGLQDNRYDMTNTVVINIDRAKYAGFTDSYLSIETVAVVVGESKHNINSWLDINRPGVRVVVTQGSVFERRARSYFPDARIVPVANPTKDDSWYSQGRTAVYLTSNLGASRFQERHPDMKVLEDVNPRDASDMAMMLPQDDQVLINFMNQWMKIKRAEGFFTKLENKWFPDSN